MKHAFILSDCEYPDCTEKPYALLTANLTREHHFIAQTEQRQHAHNPQVSQQNQNVYRLPKALFRKPFHGRSDNVNIISNLAAQNLYTLTQAEDGAQYNLESWFNRHESGYEDACAQLRRLPEGSVNVPEALWRILRLKFLGILRNPYNHQNLFAHRIHKAIRAQLPDTSFEFVRLISQRNPKRIESILHDYGFNFLGYVNWLSNLYGMLSEGVKRPSLFEQMFRVLFDTPEAVRIELYRYPKSGLCLFNDRGFCVQESKRDISVGVNIAADMFAIVHLQADVWHRAKRTFHTQQTKKQGLVHITDQQQQQRQTFNRLSIYQAQHAVFGKSARAEDYF